MSPFNFIDNYLLFESIDSGLGDRMLSIIGFIVLCETINFKPVIKFNSINTFFEWGSCEYDIKNFIFDFHDIIYNETNNYCRKITNQTSITMSPLKLNNLLKQNHSINYIEFSKKYKIIASKIKPSKLIEEYLPKLEDVYGIHLRKTDKIKPNRQIEHENSLDEFNCIISNLINDIIQLLKNEKETKLLIVSEDKLWIDEFKKMLKCRYDTNDINFINILYPDFENNKNFNVVLDMFCLSQCKKIYQGVKWSTFSALAALIGNVDIINYYNVLPEHETNFIYTWKSVLNINGKIDYTEYENIGNRLGDIQIKYINKNNILF